MADDFTITFKRFDPEDPRLGRHVRHDSRSLRYRAAARDPLKLATIRHSILIGLMNQGNVGSCTGHGGTNNIAFKDFWPAAKDAIGPGDPHVFAVRLYGDATALDPWEGTYEPDDTGSDGLSIAKVLHARNLISGYQHATSLEAALTALAVRPVMIGSSWLSGMYEVDKDGHMAVTGQSVGGHEYILDELDVEQRRVWMRNSWGTTWGQGGRAWMSWDDLGKLLDDQGDCTVLVPNTEPAPQPTPVEPQPSTPPTADAELAPALKRFLHTNAAPAYLRAKAQPWLNAFFKE